MHYTGTIWRPPYEASSLLLEVTAGCTHHQCKFCTLYHDLPFKFRMTPLEDIEADLKEVKSLLGAESHVTVSRTFLTGANPFALNTTRLLKIADLIRQHFPGNKTIGCFSRITDITTKTDEDLKQLKHAGYNDLTIGMETGDDQALAFMHKGYTAKDIITQCRPFRCRRYPLHILLSHRDFRRRTGKNRGKKDCRNLQSASPTTNRQPIC